MITIPQLQQDVVESIIDMMILLRMPCPCCGGEQKERHDTSGHTVECSLGAIQFDSLVKSIGKPLPDDMVPNPFVVDAFWRWGAQLTEMEADFAKDVTPPNTSPTMFATDGMIGGLDIRSWFMKLFGD